MVEEALKSNRGLIEHVGGVYSERQAGYFRSIDCFLFPFTHRVVRIVFNKSARCADLSLARI